MTIFFYFVKVCFGWYLIIILKLNENMLKVLCYMHVKINYYSFSFNSFPSLAHIPRTWLFMSNSAGVSRKAEDAYRTGAPGPCSQFLVRVAHLLCMYNFSYFLIFVVYACFPCLVFVPGLHSFGCRFNLGSLGYSCI